MKENFIFFRDLYLFILKGWYTILLSFGIYIKDSWTGKNRIQQTFIVMLFIQTVLGYTNWLYYHFDFGQGPEKITTSVKLNYIFTIGSFTCLLIFLTGRGILSWLLHLLILLTLATLFVSGALFPNPVFTEIIHAQDYGFRVVFYLFGTALFANIILLFLNRKRA